MWVELTEDDVRTRLSASELSALEGEELAEGQESPLADIVAGVVREVRGRVAACASNALGDGDTIPDELRHHALALVRFRLCTRLPGMQDLLDDRRTREYEAALSALRDVAACKFAIEQPATPSDEQVAGPSVELISSRERRATRERMEGL